MSFTKVGVVVGEGAAHVVVLAAAGRHQLLELGHDPLPAAVAGVVHPEAVVDLLAPVQAEHHVAHLPVAEVDHVVVDEHAVGGEGEAEVLAGLLFDGAGVGHQLLDHLEVHQRLAAEEVHLQVPARAGVLHQKVQRPLAHLKAHDGPLAVVLALAGKAVGAVEVAGVGHMQAQRLDDAGALFLELARHGGKGVRREELPLVLQGADLRVAGGDLFGGDVRVLFRAWRRDLLPALRPRTGRSCHRPARLPRGPRRSRCPARCCSRPAYTDGSWMLLLLMKKCRHGSWRHLIVIPD